MKLHANARTCPTVGGCWLSGSMRGGRWRRRPRPPESATAPRRSGGLAGAPRVRSACSIGPRLRSGFLTARPVLRVEAIVALRRLRMTAAEIAELLSMALSTVSAVLRRVGLGKLSRLDPPEPAESLRARPTGRPVARRHQKARADPQSLAIASSVTDAARRSVGPKRTGRRRLGVRARLRRRRHPARLRRSAQR